MRVLRFSSLSKSQFDSDREMDGSKYDLIYYFVLFFSPCWVNFFQVILGAQIKKKG